MSIRGSSRSDFNERMRLISRAHIIGKLQKLEKKERDIVQQAVGSYEYPDVKSFLLQKCHVQDPESLSMSIDEILAHCRQYLRGQQPQQDQAETVDKAEQPGSGDNAEIPQGKTPTETEKKAYDSYKWIQDNQPDLLLRLKPKQRYSLQMYECVKEHCPLYRPDEGEQIPSFDSWQRYIRAYEQKLHGLKNTPRAGRDQPRGVEPSQLQSLSEVTSKFKKSDTDSD